MDASVTFRKTGSFAVHPIAGLQSVQVERDLMNKASEKEASSFMPYEPVDIRNAMLMLGAPPAASLSIVFPVCRRDLQY